MSYIEAHKDRYGVAAILRVLDEPSSTYYDRCARAPSARAVTDAALTVKIKGHWTHSKESYGAPRVHAMLAREGVHVGRKRVARLMREAGIQGIHLRKHWRTTRQDPRSSAAPDLVDRKFVADAPDRLWVADFTYVHTQQGVLYLATVLDVFSRKIVGWQMSDRMTTDLVLSAFEMGLYRRNVARQQLVHHSDKGSQYTSMRFSQRLLDVGVSASTGSVGDSYDNAMAESFFSTIKRELIYRQTWTSRHDADLAIFSWIEGWYNAERIQQALGMLSPDEYETAHQARLNDTPALTNA